MFGLHGLSVQNHWFWLSAFVRVLQRPLLVSERQVIPYGDRCWQVEGKIGPIGCTAPEDIRAFDPKIGNLINKQEGWRSHKGDPTVGQFSR